MGATLLILAAGMGSRYGGLKQLDQLGPNGETIMDYSVYDAIKAGFDRVVFVIRRDIEDEFKKVIGSRYADKIAVDYAYQVLDDLPANFSVPAGREKPWGTGQAVYAARNVVKEPFAIINADDFYGADSFKQLATELKSSTQSEVIDGFMCGYFLENTLSENGSVSRGVCSTDANGNLETVVEHTVITRENDKIISTFADGTKQELNAKTLVSMNCWGFNPAIFGELERLFSEFLSAKGSELKSEFYIPFVADQLIQEGRAKVKMLTSNASWFGVTYREDRPVVVNALKEMTTVGEYPEKLF